MDKIMGIRLIFMKKMTQILSFIKLILEKYHFLDKITDKPIPNDKRAFPDFVEPSSIRMAGIADE